MFKPSYLKLFSSGELRNRILTLNEKLAICNVCPRDCGVNRNISDSGYCHSGKNTIIEHYSFDSQKDIYLEYFIDLIEN